MLSIAEVRSPLLLGLLQGHFGFDVGGRVENEGRWKYFKWAEERSVRASPGFPDKGRAGGMCGGTVMAQQHDSS
jgi:hypothetical protein